jgi:hypothetical protein
MRLGYLLLAGITVTLIACGEKPVTVPQGQSSSACGNFLSNDEIITTTKKCNSEGLDAVPLHCGDDYQTVIVECRPRPLSTPTSEEQ